jgi:hypothetical protein
VVREPRPERRLACGRIHAEDEGVRYLLRGKEGTALPSCPWAEGARRGMYRRPFVPGDIGARIVDVSVARLWPAGDFF